jgi:bifunctional non-homologous end joining protein LigD
MDQVKRLVFVIHKHKATSLHYDFRLQIGGVMPSWAVPKGPTLDPTKKRLAMHVDDHSLRYRTFEGVLPDGGYGAGPVMIWDEGYYLPEVEVEKGVRKAIDDFAEGNTVMEEGVEKGEIKFQLFGKKLKGSFALVKTKGFGPKNAWLIIIHKDEYVNEGYDANDYEFSATSGKSIEEIEKEKVIR